MRDERLTQVQVKYTGMLMRKPNVVGVGIGYVKENDVATAELGLIVMVSKKLPEDQLPPKDRIPDELDGVRVDVQEVGTFGA